MSRALALALLAVPAAADPAEDVARTALGLLPDLPALVTVDAVAGRCGAGADAAPEGAAYCTGANAIYATPAFRARPDAAALTAHLYGHALQVRLGVADVALRTIRANPAEEATLRMDVERMVWCIAGHLAAEAGHAAAPAGPGEPFTGSHWGANLGRGPQVSIGMDDVRAWFASGAEDGLAACDTPSFPADLIREGL